MFMFILVSGKLLTWTCIPWLIPVWCCHGSGNSLLNSYMYVMYGCILYMSPLYIHMFLYFSISLFYLSYFIWLYCVCPPFLNTVFFLSWITCNVMHVYFVFHTMYLVQVYWNKLCSVLIINNLSLPQVHSFISTVWLWTTDEYVFIWFCAKVDR